MPGREAVPEDDAAGRPLEVCFFEPVPDPPPGDTIVRRVDRTSSGMRTLTYSPSQILVALGLHAPKGPDETPAEWEAAVEARYKTSPRLAYEHAVVPDRDEPHVYLLTHARDVEDEFLDTGGLDARTRMALARLLEREQGEVAQALLRARANTLESLTRRAIGPAAADAVAAAGKAKAKARAKAKAKAKAHA